MHADVRHIYAGTELSIENRDSLTVFLGDHGELSDQGDKGSRLIRGISRI